MSQPSRVYRSDSAKALFEDIKDALDSTISFDSNDLLVFDTTAFLVKKTTGAVGDGAVFLGISPIKVVSGKLASPYQGTAVDASEAASALPGPRYGVTAKLKLTSGDVMHYGDAVYLSALDAQTVQKTANGSSIGIYVGPTHTAASGDEGLIKLGCRYLVGALTF